MYSEVWTLEKIKEGFKRFFEANGRYPTALEIDDFDFLPSSRQIQRKFGGLPNLRKNLHLPIENYTMGDSRSVMASKINKRGRNSENIVFEILKNRFDYRFIHIEKPIDTDYKDRYDFYVYARPSNFAIDVFSTDGDIRHFIKILNIKENKYKRHNVISENLYFIYIGSKIRKDRIHEWLERKREALPQNWLIMDIQEFSKELSKYDSWGII